MAISYDDETIEILQVGSFGIEMTGEAILRLTVPLLDQLEDVWDAFDSGQHVAYALSIALVCAGAEDDKDEIGDKTAEAILDDMAALAGSISNDTLSPAVRERLRVVMEQSPEMLALLAEANKSDPEETAHA
jgi:hypothetical protein